MTERLNVLVADENEPLRERLAEALPRVVGDEDVAVDTAEAGDTEAVWDALETSRVDCVVVSTRMTNGDGDSLSSAVQVEGVPVVSYERTNPSDIDIENLGRVVYDAARNSVGSLNHRALFEAVNVGLAVRDLETLELVDINQQYADLLGDDPESLLNTFPIDITADVPNYTAERARNEVNRAIQTGSNVFLWPIEGAGDEAIWIRVSLTVAELSGRRRLISTVEDVTEEQRRERELESLKHAVDSVDAGVTITEDSVHKYANEAAARIFGYPDAESLVGLSWTELYDDWEVTRIRELVQPELDETGKWQGEVQLKQLPGDTIPVRLSITALPDERYVVVFQDLTEQKKRERELERSRDFLERTQRISKVGGWELDLETNTLAWTEQTKRIHEVPLDYDPSLEDAFEFYVPDDRERVRTVVERCRDDGVPWEEEFQIVTAKGAELWVRTRGEPVIRNGRVAALRGTIQDVTTRRNREQELERTNAELEALNRIVRHDIRNDMTVIVGWAELLSDHVDESGNDILQRILSTGRHTIEITEVARDLIETMSGGVVETHPVGLAETLDRELASIRHAFPQATFDVDGEIPDVAVRANPLLASAFGNVLNNAVQHTGEETMVTVSVTADDDVATIEIADNGPGIPDNRKDMVFGKGEKGLDSSGTGLGLYLVYKLVDSYGGEIHIEDNDPTGTVVIIELPVATPE
ncbi:PAS domain S-box protein [Haloferax larsenii]|uniref:histidine kinase n=1 Tax=Haloferax larsenii TaxID=302484 RepID=A0ABY5RFM1_HALLR|nr:PAS domain S-box protein [Haloferax larsenii]UVE50964.1 PAS domain S-box protein [Haloferax larsenii]